MRRSAIFQHIAGVARFPFLSFDVILFLSFGAHSLRRERHFCFSISLFVIHRTLKCTVCIPILHNQPMNALNAGEPCAFVGGLRSIFSRIFSHIFKSSAFFLAISTQIWLQNLVLNNYAARIPFCIIAFDLHKCAIFPSFFQAWSDCNFFHESGHEKNAPA